MAFFRFGLPVQSMAARKFFQLLLEFRLIKLIIIYHRGCCHLHQRRLSLLTRAVYLTLLSALLIASFVILDSITLAKQLNDINLIIV